MIGENVRRIRMDRGLTQIELAKKSGVSVALINQIEWGAKGMSVPTLIRIAQALRCPTDEILSEEAPNGTVDQRAGS